MRNDIPLTWFLYFAAASFSIGLAGVLMRRNAIAVLMAIEIMLNAANVNLVAFWRYGPERPEAGPMSGVILAIFVLTVLESACVTIPSEVTLGLGGALASGAVIAGTHGDLNLALVILVGSPLTNSTRHVVQRALPPQACRISTPASSSIALTRRLPPATSTV